MTSHTSRERGTCLEVKVLVNGHSCLTKGIGGLDCVTIFMSPVS